MMKLFRPRLLRPRDCLVFVLPLVPVLGCWACLIPLIAADELAVPGVLRSELSDPEHPVHQAFQGERLDLWSLKPPRVDAVPGFISAEQIAENSVRLSSEVIDVFIRRQLSAAGLKPAPETDRRRLIRRVTFDLTGLPPTPKEVQAFVEDPLPRAYERLVERLLASPAYGERWARHWLDVVRYADTEGFERDEFRPQIWQFRDYVIRSLQQDKPFDQFLREQLAGDELVEGPPATPAEVDSLIATGFLRLGSWDSTAAIFQEEARHRDQQQGDLANTTASAFLGLTLACCQCHDHKYDPLLQVDHFRFRAFFAAVAPRNDLVIELAAEQTVIASHNAELEQLVAPVRAELAKLDKDKPEDQPRFQELSTQISELERQQRSPRTAMGATDSGAEAPATHLFYQGDYSEPRQEVAPGFPSVVEAGAARITAPRAETTGRRRALAEWIASRQNPWTARVFVNRVWQQHFGTGLVATANDFGFSGSRPTHPELLDWLAVAWMNDGWSIKRLHQAILCSATYRQASNEIPEHNRSADSTRVPDENLRRDPENRLLWRQNVKRLDAETLRDSLLTVSGALRPYDAGKPLWPFVPLELLHAQPGILEAKDGGDGGRMQGWYEDPLEATDVRSLYLVRKRSLPIPFLQVFDLPDTTVSCSRRETTVVAPQALMLFNSPEAVRFAQILATRIMSEKDAAAKGPVEETGSAAERSWESRVERVFQTALSRLPDPEELSVCRELLTQHHEQYCHEGHTADEAERLSLRDLCRAVMNLNEFLYID